MGSPAAHERDEVPMADDLWGVPPDAVEVDDPTLADRVLSAQIAALSVEPDIADRMDTVDRTDGADLGDVASLLAVSGDPGAPEQPPGPDPGAATSTPRSRRGRREQRAARPTNPWNLVGVAGFLAGCLLVGAAAGLLVPDDASSPDRVVRTSWPQSGARVVVDGPANCPMYVLPAGAPASSAPPFRNCFVVR